LRRGALASAEFEDVVCVAEQYDTGSEAVVLTSAIDDSSDERQISYQDPDKRVDWDLVVKEDAETAN
jgi:hypothetical protein